MDSHMDYYIQTLQDEIDRLNAVLKDFAEFGTRHDLTPTLMRMNDPQYLLDFFHRYIESMDNYVRTKAKESLTKR